MVKPYVYGRPGSRGGIRAEVRYLLLENGQKIRLEQRNGYLLLEHQNVGTVSDWGMHRGSRL